MLRNLWDRFAFVALDEDDASRGARILRAIIWTLLGASVVTLGFEGVILHRPALRLALWAGIGLFLISLWLVGRGRLAPARFAVTLAALSIISLVLYTGVSGIHSVTTMMLPAVIVIGALVLSRTGFFAITALTILSAVGLVVADIHHVIDTPYHDIASYMDAVAPVLFLLFTAIMVRLLAADLARSLDGARRNATALAEANRRLAEQAESLQRSADARRAFEARLQHAQKLESLGRLAGGIAHDFNNLLMAILGNIELALDMLPPGSAAHQSLLAAGTASGRATELTRQMLAYAGRGKYSVDEVDLSRLVDGMADMLRVAVSKRAALRFDLAGDLPSVRGDVAQIRQVLMNLVVNASEALGDRDGAIGVSTKSGFFSRSDLTEQWQGDDLPEGTYVRLDVSDTGCGMDGKTVQRVFDPFFTTKFTGRGLGLAVVLGIVRGHKAAVKIATELGRGSTFSVLFPATPAAQPDAAPDAGAAARRQDGGQVLLVDDEDAVRVPARAMLARLGYDVIEASDGREAVSSFAANRGAIRCVLLDLTMPQMNGEETFKALRAIDPSVRVVVASGYGEQDMASRFGDGLPAGFIQKPYTLQTLGEALSQALSRT
jgi:signal transduction histidine kinase